MNEELITLQELKADIRELRNSVAEIGRKLDGQANQVSTNRNNITKLVTDIDYVLRDINEIRQARHDNRGWKVHALATRMFWVLMGVLAATGLQILHNLGGL